MTELMNFAQSVAREAGELILCEREQADLVHDYKGGNELVTNADIKADQLIRTRIEQRFAEHRLLSEESSPELQRVWESEVPVWIVDPIDGTVNYAHGHIQSAVSIAYCEQCSPPSLNRSGVQWGEFSRPSPLGGHQHSGVKTTLGMCNGQFK